MRIVALLLAVALIVISGFWLARDRSEPEATGDGALTAESVAGDDLANQSSEPPATDEPGDQGGAADGEQDGGQDGETPNGEADGETGGDAGGDAADIEAQGDASAAATAGPLPEGYEQVEYVSQEPRRVFDAAGEVLEDGLDYVATLRTNKGDIVVDLYEDRTPVTVNNFVFLALNRYYQDVPFHRVIEGFMAQTGDPTGTGTGGPGYQFDDEIVEELTFDRRGLLAMANAGPGTNGSQFFITFDATPWLNGAHTIFGHVLSGEELLDEITRVDAQQPTAIGLPTDTLADLAEQGVTLPGEDDQTVESAIEAALGTAPVAGQSFTVGGYRGVLGAVGGNPAYGFFAPPDEIQSVVIGTRQDAE